MKRIISGAMINVRARHRAVTPRPANVRRRLVTTNQLKMCSL